MWRFPRPTRDKRLQKILNSKKKKSWTKCNKIYKVTFILNLIWKFEERENIIPFLFNRTEKLEIDSNEQWMDKQINV